MEGSASTANVAIIATLFRASRTKYLRVDNFLRQHVSFSTWAETDTVARWKGNNMHSATHARILTVAVAALLAAPVFAQQSQPTQQPANSQQGTVNNRRQDQQGRIANGVQSGQLTAGETKRLETREGNLNTEIHNDRSADGGALTQQQRNRVNRQQNRLSRSIYADKHNAARAHYGNNEVGQRRQNQQDRVANGIRNGSMDAHEAARTENREQGINRQIGADRSTNGGRLTGAERGQVNREQNGASRQIYRQKHNRAHAPK